MSIPLSIRTFTWKRDSHGLFDYETKDMAINNFKTVKSGRVILAGESCEFNTENSLPLEGVLVQVYETNNEYVIRSEKQDRFWFVVKDYHGEEGYKGYKLSEDDIIKIGRIKLKVKEINYKGYEPIQELKDEEEDERPSNGAACRFCLGDTEKDNNPLITPCKCSGSMRFIHYKCLQVWLMEKVKSKQTGNSVSYSWTQLQCEICKELYPTSIKIEGKLCPLIDVHKPPLPYIILQDLRNERSEQSLHVLSSVDNSIVKIGRGHENEIRVSDISVSRCHSTIKISRNGFFLEDNDSKFGTLVLARKPVLLKRNSSLVVQCKRTVIQFSLKEPYNLMRICLVCCRSSSEIAPEQQVDERGQEWEEELSEQDEPSA
ncbi:unnamed protein product [Blepharisma stoltei]|uniref:RING-CH-type domain-containing protein n=1 Tax=Blepharisma stoltei TaxID=1481888 RepID=A0AAU9JC44_9CILI|nr:unnamed protein product [Blepharisma stoltei]